MTDKQAEPNAKHAPTPWHVTKWEDPQLVVESSKGFICQTLDSNDAANADFIVRACNAHDDLTSYMKEFRDNTKNHEHMTNSQMKFTLRVLHDKTSQICHLLAKAEANYDA